MKIIINNSTGANTTVTIQQPKSKKVNIDIEKQLKSLLSEDGLKKLTEKVKKEFIQEVLLRQELAIDMMSQSLNEGVSSQPQNNPDTAAANQA